MQRVLIIGSSGAGKSTLAVRLGKVTGLPLVHLDREYWQPGWVEPDKAEWEAHVRELIARDAWILDGNYSATLEMRMPAADTVIFLDMPRTVCVWRMLKRWIRYRGIPRPDMSAGCNEKMDLKFLMWVWDYPNRTRPKAEQLLEGFTGDVVRLRSSGEVEEWMQKQEEMEPRKHTK